MVKKIDCEDLTLQHMELCFHLNIFMFIKSNLNCIDDNTCNP